MKRILSITAILSLAFLFMSAITIMEVPQDPPKDKKVKKQVKMVKIENGEKVELDTIIEGDNVFVWKGDTINGGKDLKWITKGEFNLDSLHQHFDMDFDFEMNEDGEGNVFIIKSGKGDNKMVKEFKINGDHEVMMWHNNKSKNDVFFGDAPMPPHAPHMMIMNKNKKNVIDLSDPGVISFKKKKLSGGREKVTIIRNEVDEKEVEIEQDIIIDTKGNHPMIWHQKEPGKTRAIKIIKEDDGKVEMIESEDIFNIKKGDKNVKIIKEGENIIHITETKKGDEKEVEVKVTVEEEKKKEQNN